MSSINSCSSAAKIKYVEKDLSCDKYITTILNENDEKNLKDITEKPELKDIKLTVDKLVIYTNGNSSQFSYCTNLYE